MSQAAINIHNKNAEKAAKGYNNSGQLIGLIFLLIVVSSFMSGSWMVINWMQDARHLLLSKLVITGERYYTTNDDIRQAILALGVPSTFMKQNVNMIQKQIELMPWIKQVSVRKQWPDELKIHVVEYIAIAHWNNQRLLDSNGIVFSIPPERINNQPIPMLYGPENSEQDVLNGYRTMNKVLTAANLQIKAISMNTRHSWQLILQDNICLELGRSDKTIRLERFIRIYPVLLQHARNSNKRISYVDLRYDSGLAVGWATAKYKTIK